MITVRFMTLAGKFTFAKDATFPDMPAAVVAITTYAEAGGYSNVKAVNDDGESIRYTAKTPGGRGGRNVAYIDLF